MVINPETVEFDSLESLEAFILYQPNMKIGSDAGFLLADNLLNQKGGILYPKGMDLDGDRLARLRRLHENNPEWEFSFSLLKNDRLKKTLASRIINQFERILKARKGKNEYRRLMERVEKLLEKYQDELFSLDDFVYVFYQTWFTELSNSEDGRTPYFWHQLSTTLWALGIVNQAHQVLGIKFENEDYLRVLQTAILKNMAGIEGVAFAKKKTPEELQAMYIQANSNSYAVAKRLQMAAEVCDAVRLCSDYDQGKRDMVTQDDAASKYANIVIAADFFDSRILGLFAQPKPPQEAADKMYVAAQEKHFVKAYVDALAKGLKFGQLFDFYFEIERLSNACSFGPGKLGRPYPMTGFKSPVIYVCKGHMVKCPYFSASTKSVTIFKKIGDLDEGSYGRCELLSKQLLRFYEQFYDQIKEETQTRSNSSE